MKYKFKGKEKDEETGMYYFGARYYDADLSVWLSVDPMADKYPSMSPFMYCAGNPVVLIDPNGMDIDPTASGFQDAENAAKNQPAFDALFNKWKTNTNILVRFSTDEKDRPVNENGERCDGTATPSGVTNDGKQIYTVAWNPNEKVAEKLGTSPLFEEAAHLENGIEGRSDLTSNTLNDEVMAKIWVAKNITNISDFYTDKLSDTKQAQFKTHFGWVKTNSNFPNKIKSGLFKGVFLTTYINNDMYKDRSYRVYATGTEGYKKMAK